MTLSLTDKQARDSCEDVPAYQSSPLKLSLIQTAGLFFKDAGN